MSKAGFDKLLTESIIKRASDVVRSMPESQVYLNDKGRLAVKESSSLSLATIREQTNSTGYQSLFSRGGLVNLANSFSAYVDKNAAFESVATFLRNPDLYNNFRDYVASLYTKESDSIGGSSTVSYSYKSYSTQGTQTLRIATSKSGENSNDDFILLKDLKHGELKKLFLQFVSEKSDIPSSLYEVLKDNIDGGHLAGVFNLRFSRVFNLQTSTYQATGYDDMSVSATNSVELSSLFQGIMTTLNDADYISSNIYYDPTLFSSLAKNLYTDTPTVSAEMQLKASNTEAGRALSAVGLHLNNLIIAVSKVAGRDKVDTVGAKAAVNGMLKNLSSVYAIIRKRADELKKLDTEVNKKASEQIAKILTRTDTVEQMLSTAGSDTFIESIQKTLAARIIGKALPAPQKTKVSKTTKPVENKAKQKASAPKVKNPTSKKITSRGTKVPKETLSLTSLQNLLNQRLHDQIKANMGTGQSSAILNYRSGRLASSANVERLSESRAGMITAFYTYMKYPYATFSKGGRQQYPNTHDPKLLISKSIREILGSQLSNKLRAVNV